MASKIRNRRLQGGSTWEISGNLNVLTSGLISMPVVNSTSAKAPLSNYGLVVCKTSDGTAAAKDFRVVPAPTRAGLMLGISCLCETSGVNIGFASDSSSFDVQVVDSTHGMQSIWEVVKLTTQRALFVSSSTSEWICLTPTNATWSTSGTS